MLDGQGCFLPVRHFHREESSLMLSSWSSGRYPTCRAEASAESTSATNGHPLPHHIRESCRSSPVAEVERESNHGSLLDLNISSSFHSNPSQFVEVDDTQTEDINGKLADEGDPPCISLHLTCSSTNPSRSSPALFSFWPVPGLGAGDAQQKRSSDDELEGVGSSHCIQSEFESLPSEFSRSMEGEGRSKKVLGGNEISIDFLELASMTKEGDLASSGRDGGGIEEGKATERPCIWQDAESVGSRRRSRTGDDCSGVCQKVSEFLDSNGEILGLGCAGTNCTDSKETEDSCSETAIAGKVFTKHRSFECSAAEEGGSSLEYSDKRVYKKLRTINGIDTGYNPLPGIVATCAPREMVDNSADDHTSKEQQPYLPGLDNESALRCLALVPLSGLGRLSRVCRQYRDLIKSRFILKLRRTYGMVEHLVFIYTSGLGGWTAYDANRNVWRSLPPPNVNPDFDSSDKESLSAGTHVLWLGKEVFDFVYYRYDLLTNSWEKGPSMINPRCLFASASCGDFAFVAGGFGPADNSGALSLLNSAERYNSLTGEWEHLPPMSMPRHKCSGFFMDGKFYVIGGRDANHQPIMSGEEYNPSTGVWRTIPNMYFAPEIHKRDMFEPSPPLVAVVNNQLYAVENTTNALKIYNKHNNTWSNLGYLPVPADLRNGWGVAFKALGDMLFVMGDVGGIAACGWKPGLHPTEPVWHLLSHRERGVDSFLYNCAVMNC